jgi:hypothetical protein
MCGRIVLTPIPDPLWLALYGPKFAEITVEEVEKYSEEMQEGYLKKPKPPTTPQTSEIPGYQYTPTIVAVIALILLAIVFILLRKRR